MQTHTIQIGTIECTVLADGTATFGLEGVANRFPQIALKDLAQALTEAGVQPDDAGTSYNTLLIKTAGQLVLVDGGERKDRHATAGKTVACLASLGIQPADIDIVFITHAHGDHIIGLIETDGSLTYPNARHLINEQEWQQWDGKNDLLNTFKGIIEFIDLDAEIAPGVMPLPLYGHTLGQTGLTISSDGSTLVHAIDLIHAPFQFAHPDWTIRFDTDPEQAYKTRLNLFNQHADDNTLTFFFHASFPALGHIQRNGDAFKFNTE